jgi:hypothetical protein
MYWKHDVIVVIAERVLSELKKGDIRLAAGHSGERVGGQHGCGW